MLGCVAAVIETESPSQPRPAVIQRMCTSLTAGAFCVDRPYGTVSGALAGCSFSNQKSLTTRLLGDVWCGANDGFRPHVAAHSRPNRTNVSRRSVATASYADCADLKFRSGIRINPLRNGDKGSHPVLFLQGSPTGEIGDSLSRQGDQS